MVCFGFAGLVILVALHVVCDLRWVVWCLCCDLQFGLLALAGLRGISFLAIVGGYCFLWLLICDSICVCFLVLWLFMT